MTTYAELCEFTKNNPAAGARTLAKMGISLRKAHRLLAKKRSGALTPEAFTEIMRDHRYVTTCNQKLKPSMSATVTSPLPSSFKTAINAEAFRKQFDIPAKIKEGIKLLDGVVISDNDFRTELGISIHVWRAVASRPEFSDYRLDVKGKVYWGQQATLKSVSKTMDIL